MKYCSQCGARVSLTVPAGDHLPRFVCGTCLTIHYTNPKIVAGCIPEWEDQILLCRRAIEPRSGLWTFPAGFMEEGETTGQAAARETWEEAKASVEHLSLYAVFSLPHVSQVYVVFRGRLQSLEFAAGSESLDVRLFHRDAIPWDALAFSVVREILTHYVRDRSLGRFQVHVGAVPPMQKEGVS
jgi:ADP-ribose pyrophosphatase YjhB (NUDIX family)